MTKGFSLGFGTLVRFEGQDRCRVLNNLCTQDLRKLGSGQTAETFVTDVKGRTFGHGIAFGLDERLFFVSVPDQAARLVPHFDRYIIREDATVSDQSARYAFWIFQDRETVATAFAISLEQTPEPGQVVRLELEGSECILIHAAWIGPESCLCLVQTGASDRAIQERLGSDWAASDLETRAGWEHLRIHAGWPWYGLDLDDKNLPQELDRDRAAISFNKGCYLGQETIARLDALGQVQKKLVKLTISVAVVPNPQTPVYAEDKEVGAIRSAAVDQKVHWDSIGSIGSGGFGSEDRGQADQIVAFAYVKRSHFQSGTKLLVNSLEAVVL